MRLKIEKLIYGGEGLARLPGDEHGPGKSAFVPFVLANEEIEAAIVEKKRGFVRVGLESVIEPSPLRVAPGCPYFQRCGGCHYQYTSYENQLAIKAEILRETLRRTAKIDLPCELQVHASPPWNYRNRTRLKIQTKPEFSLGYYKFRSHQLLPIEQCPISSSLINRAVVAVWSKGRAGLIPESVREIELFTNDSDDALLLELYVAHGTSPAQAQQTCESLADLLPELKGAIAFEQHHEGQLTEPRHLAQYGDGFLRYKARSFDYKVSAGSFFQVNRFLVSDLVTGVTGSACGKMALDLYAGVGLFSAALAQDFAQVIAVESSQTSHADLGHNAPPEVKTVRATTEQFLAKFSGSRPDLVIADPPRAGLGENVVSGLARLSAPRMVYVSCDPSTLARDLRGLLSLGYRIEQAHLLDMFPQTFHIESIIHLIR